MYLILHAFVFVPAAVFCAVAAVCWVVCVVIDRRAASPAPRFAQPARRGFRPVVIEGGAIGSFRVRQSPLGSAGAVAKIGAARSYGG